MVEAWWNRADRAVAAVVVSGRWLAMPVSLLLCIQWPLRDIVQAYSIEANDLAQCLFALYVSLAVTDATREQAHLAADAFAQRYGALNRRRIARAAVLCCLVPWSLFVLVAGAPIAWRSIVQLESFPETYSAGYFIIKAGGWLLALLVLTQALLDIARPGSRK
jgi:TRAP-type C4-dicarboxylate transport system permease small subunit